MTHFIPEGFSDWLSSDDGALLRGDIERWKNWCRSSNGETLIESFAYLFSNNGGGVFRKIADYRAFSSRQGGRFGGLLPDLSRVDMSIECPRIGPGLIVQHGTATYIFAREIGARFWINQNVTVGSDGRGEPKIGDNVTIRTGAVVVGEITIGDNVHIGANAVVNFDVPSNSRVYAARSVIVPNR